MKKCPDCNGELEKGCLIDQTYGAITVQRYARSDVPDTPNKVALRISEEKFYDLRKTIAFRCKQCNRIFLYALNTITVPNLSKRIRKWLITMLVIIAVIIIGAIIIGILSSSA